MELRADCTRCAGLCCVAPAFTASADFAIDKPAGRPCPNLRPDSGCAIHGELRERGFPGCTVYDCFGAGQRVVQDTFAGSHWRDEPSMLAVFGVVRHLHELLWYLTEALALAVARPRHRDLARMRDEVERLAGGEPEAILDIDVAAVRGRANVVLQQASELARASVRGRRPDRRGADLVAASLAGADLRGVNLRGAYLIGADLSRADLTLADVTGADLRGADLAGADLSGTLFLTQAQLDAARGDPTTRLPTDRSRPAHWSR